jgi:hypothetical protein
VLSFVLSAKSQLCTYEPQMLNCAHGNGTNTQLDLTSAFDGPNYNGGRRGKLVPGRRGTRVPECGFWGENNTAGCILCTRCELHLAKRPGWTHTINATDGRLMKLTMHGFGDCNHTTGAFKHIDENYCDGIPCIHIGQIYRYLPDSQIIPWNVSSWPWGLCKFNKSSATSSSNYSLHHFSVLQVELSVPSSVEFTQTIHKIDGRKSPSGGSTVANADEYEAYRVAGAVFGRSVRDGTIVFPSSMSAGWRVDITKTAEMDLNYALSLGLRATEAIQGIPVFESNSYWQSNVTTVGFLPFGPGNQLGTSDLQTHYPPTNAREDFEARLKFTESIDAIYYLFTYADTLVDDFGKYNFLQPDGSYFPGFNHRYYVSQPVDGGYAIPQTTEYWPTFGCGGLCGVAANGLSTMMRPTTAVYGPGVCNEDLKLGGGIKYNADIGYTQSTGLCAEVRKCVVKSTGLYFDEALKQHVCMGLNEERLINTTNLRNF